MQIEDKDNSAKLIAILKEYGLCKPNLLNIDPNVFEYVQRFVLANLCNDSFIGNYFCNTDTLKLKNISPQIYYKVMADLVARNIKNVTLIQSLLLSAVFNPSISHRKRVMFQIQYVGGMISWLKEGAMEDEIVLQTLRHLRLQIVMSWKSLEMRGQLKGLLEKLLAGLKVDIDLVGRDREFNHKKAFNEYSRIYNKVKKGLKNISWSNIDALFMRLKEILPNEKRKLIDSSIRMNKRNKLIPSQFAQLLAAKKFGIRISYFKNIICQEKRLAKLS